MNSLGILRPVFFIVYWACPLVGYLVIVWEIMIKMALYCPQGSGTLRQQLLMMHGIAWHCNLLHGIACYCMVLHVIAWYCMVLHGIAWFCKVLHGIALYCMVLHGIA